MDIIVSVAIGITCALVSGLISYRFGKSARYEDRRMDMKNSLINEMMQIQAMTQDRYLFKPRCKEMNTAISQLDTRFKVYIYDGGFIFRLKSKKVRDAFKQFVQDFRAINIPHDNQHAKELAVASCDIANRLDSLILDIAKLRK